MKKTFIFAIIIAVSLTALACGDANKSLMSGSRGKGLIGMLIDGANRLPAADEPAGDDALSASTNHSSKRRSWRQARPAGGAAFVRPPQINNYGTGRAVIPDGGAGGPRGYAALGGLSYSSSGGDGLCGIGWSLSSGLGTISRTASHGGALLRLPDTFTFNGKRLVKVSGPVDNENGTYRCEIESDFSRFELTEAERAGVARVRQIGRGHGVRPGPIEPRIPPRRRIQNLHMDFSRSTDLNGNFRYAVYDDSGLRQRSYYLFERDPLHRERGHGGCGPAVCEIHL